MLGGDQAADSRYAIHVAKTALREGYKAAEWIGFSRSMRMRSLI